MPLPCPTCASPLLPLPAVLVSGPPLPDMAECERGHQVPVPVDLTEHVTSVDLGWGPTSGWQVTLTPSLPEESPHWPAGSLAGDVVRQTVERAGWPTGQ